MTQIQHRFLTVSEILLSAILIFRESSCPLQGMLGKVSSQCLTPNDLQFANNVNDVYLLMSLLVKSIMSNTSLCFSYELLHATNTLI